jgi:hypothetical protein
MAQLSRSIDYSSGTRSTWRCRYWDACSQVITFAVHGDLGQPCTMCWRTRRTRASEKHRFRREALFGRFKCLDDRRSQVNVARM